jgi:two-component system, LytTR family, sensor kinase
LQNRIIPETVSFVNRYKLYHFLFWAVYIGFWSLLLQSGISWKRDFLNATIFIFFHSLVSYFNNYYLIEWFLFKRRYFFYLVGLFLSISLVIFPLTVATFRYIPLIDESAQTIWTPNFFIYNFLFILFTVMLTTSVKLFKNWYLNEQTNKILEKLNVESELKFLKAQINPHFLFNNLNNLYALTLKQSELAPDVVLKLSNILRFGLYDSQKQQVSIDDDIRFVQDYIELEKLRLAERTEIELTVEGETMGVFIEPFLFINFIENAFKHGANPTLGKSYIKIHYKIDKPNNEIIFKVINSKPDKLNGLEKLEVGGIGLKNVQTRLNILYPNRHELKIADESNEYIVELKLKQQ